MIQDIKYGGQHVQVEIPDRLSPDVILPRHQKSSELSSAEIIRAALDHPIGADTLKNSVKPGSKVCLLVNDITRLTKSDLFVPALVDELNACGIPDSDITVLFANGMHEQMSEADMRRIISDAAYERVNIVQHDCLNAEFVYVGTTTRGTEVRVNKVAYDADFLILTGGIVPHHIAGFGGGRKDIIPGCAKRETIVNNHKMVIDPRAFAGNIVDNPMHLDLMEACAFVNPSYLFNVILDERGEIYEAVAGHWREAYMEGVRIAKGLYVYPIEKEYDVAIVSCGGAPKDIDLRQSKKGFINSSNAVKQGGTIICFAACPEGVTKEARLDNFSEVLFKHDDIEPIKEIIRNDFTIGALNAFKVRNTQKKARLILITDIPKEEMNTLRIEAYPVSEAQSVIDSVLAEGNPSVIVIPQAGLTLPIVEKI